MLDFNRIKQYKWKRYLWQLATCLHIRRGLLFASFVLGVSALGSSQLMTEDQRNIDSLFRKSEVMATQLDVQMQDITRLQVQFLEVQEGQKRLQDSIDSLNNRALAAFGMVLLAVLERIMSVFGVSIRGRRLNSDDDAKVQLK